MGETPEAASIQFALEIGERVLDAEQHRGDHRPFIPGLRPELAALRVLDGQGDPPAVGGLDHRHETAEGGIVVDQDRGGPVVHVLDHDAVALFLEDREGIREHRAEPVAERVVGEAHHGALALLDDLVGELRLQPAGDPPELGEHVGELGPDVLDRTGLGDAVIEGERARLDVQQRRQEVRTLVLEHRLHRVDRGLRGGGVVGRIRASSSEQDPTQQEERGGGSAGCCLHVLHHGSQGYALELAHQRQVPRIRGCRSS